MLIAIAEAVVYHFRYRSASGASARASGVWAFAVCALRALFIAVGASEIMGGAGVLEVVVFYAVPAGIATWIVHAWDARRSPRTQQKPAIPSDNERHETVRDLEEHNRKWLEESDLQLSRHYLGDRLEG